MRHQPSALMLFAAGFGTRMGALSTDRPKPLIKVAGRALIDHALEVADAADLSPKVINLHYRSAQIAAHLAARPDIALSWEREQILETGGGLRAAAALLGPGPVFTLNTDAVWTGANPLAQLRAAWDGARMDVLFLLLPVAAAAGHSGRSDFLMAPDGRVSWAQGAPGYVYLGAQIIETSGLDACAGPSFSLHEPWKQMIAAGRAYGVVHQGGWCDVGHPDGIVAAEAMLTRHV